MALADTDELTSPPAKVIVVEAPASSAKGVNEAAVASAIAPGIELRGSKASATASTTPSTVPPADETRLGGPRGLPSGLNGR